MTPAPPFPRGRIAVLCALVALSAPAVPGAGRAAVRVPDGFANEVVVPGLSQPVGMAFLPDGRLLVVEQKTAHVRLIANGALLADVGTVPEVNTTGGERGLLGIAVDPAWPARPYLYVHATCTGGIRISRFTCTGDLAGTGGGAIAFDASSRRDLIDGIPDAAAIHNGGTLRFGPDGMLYASLGEDSDRCAAQDSSALKGKILRLRVSTLSAAPGATLRADITPADNPFVSSADADRRLVWALGLRNPFRFNIDPSNGGLYIGDVGEARWEEIDRAAQGGLDFGWPLYEANETTTTSCAGPPQGPFTAPIFPIQRSSGASAAVICAGIYRVPSGATEPFPAAYAGDLFFADYYSGRLQRLEGSGTSWSLAAPVAGQPATEVWADGFAFVSDWLVGPDGALWYCRQSGSIERITPGEAPPDTTSTPVAPPVTFEAPWPVPSTGPVQLAYDLPVPARVVLDILDLNGRRVRWLFSGVPSAGPNAETWDGRDGDGRDVPPGLYVARLTVGSQVLSRRIMLIR